MASGRMGWPDAGKALQAACRISMRERRGRLGGVRFKACLGGLWDLGWPLDGRPVEPRISRSRSRLLCTATCQTEKKSLCEGQQIGKRISTGKARWPPVCDVRLRRGKWAAGVAIEWG